MLQEYASDELKDDFAIVASAVCKQGNVLLHSSDRAKNNYELVLIALSNCRSAINLCSSELRNGGLKKYVDELLRLRNKFYLFLSAALDKTKQLGSEKGRRLHSNTGPSSISKLAVSSLKTIADFLGAPHGLRYQRLLKAIANSV